MVVHIPSGKWDRRGEEGGQGGQGGGGARRTKEWHEVLIDKECG